MKHDSEELPESVVLSRAYSPRSRWTGHFGPDAAWECRTPEHWESNMPGGQDAAMEEFRQEVELDLL
jgi:hypothetical protein